MFARLLLAWDGSPPARRALDLAISLARTYGSEIVATSIAYSPTHAETEEDRRESVDAARQFLESSFSRVRDRAERAGVAIEQVIIESDEPAEAIVQYARDRAVDLVVVGHHRGRRRPGRLFLHGLADRLATRSDVAVLVTSDLDSERERR